MDESWKLRMGMQATTTTTTTKPNHHPRRKSTDSPTLHLPNFPTSKTLTPDEFHDVFGGPPKTILRHQFSVYTGDFSQPPSSSSSTSFYEDVFRAHQENVGDQQKSGTSLSEFRIPASGRNRMRDEEFYSDIFGSESDVRTTRSTETTTTKSSSSVLSVEELSPFRRVIRENDDVLFSSFASKLRPINVPYKWNSSTMMYEEPPWPQGMPAFPYNHPSSYIKKQYSENFRSSQFGISKKAPSPETISRVPNSHGSFKVSMEDIERLNSPSSVVSSICQDQEINNVVVQENKLKERVTEKDEVMSSYVIEINSDHKEGSLESIDIHEAIAWAKEKFQAHNSEKDWNMMEHEKEHKVEIEEIPIVQQTSDDQIDSYGLTPSQEMEMKVLEEDITQWSAGKKENIRLLLSTLHHIISTNSDWYPISLANLIESSNVKKAYQKARLCLHPDKLQQRGATIPQIYIADKAFTILQDAWAAFISQDVFFS